MWVLQLIKHPQVILDTARLLGCLYKCLFYRNFLLTGLKGGGGVPTYIDVCVCVGGGGGDPRRLYLITI